MIDDKTKEKLEREKKLTTGKQLTPKFSSIIVRQRLSKQSDPKNCPYLIYHKNALNLCTNPSQVCIT